MRLEAERDLLAPPDDVWALLSEPYHLSDWWPGYTNVRPDRRGLAEGARWQVARGASPGFLRRPGGDGLVVIGAVEPGRALAWRDVEQRFTAEISIRPAPPGARTHAMLRLDAAWPRLLLEGLRPVPRQALARLHSLCQTAASL